MAAGVKSGRFTLTDTAQSVDTLVGDVSTYNHISLRRTGGGIVIGPSGVTPLNGFPLIQGELTSIEGAVVGANLFLLGPGVVEFFGNATA